MILKAQLLKKKCLFRNHSLKFNNLLHLGKYFTSLLFNVKKKEKKKLKYRNKLTTVIAM